MTRLTNLQTKHLRCLSLAAALSGKNLTFVHPVTMSGQPVIGKELENFKLEFGRIRKVCGMEGGTAFK